jgi:hypothetical protein
MKARRLTWLCASLAALAGCGGNGAIYLTIEGRGSQGALRVPDEVDALRVAVTTADESKAWLEKDFALDPAVHRFPLTLGLEQGEATESPVRITVTALKAESPVTRSTMLTPIPREALLTVTLLLTVDDAGP